MKIRKITIFSGIVALLLLLGMGAVAQEKCGTCTPYKAPEAEAKAVFEKAFEKHLGVTFTPCCFSKKTVCQCTCECGIDCRCCEGCKTGGQCTCKEACECCGTHQKACCQGCQTEGKCTCSAQCVCCAEHGMTYSYFCFGKTATNPPKEGCALVEIRTDKNGEVKEKKIIDTKTTMKPGGWTGFKPLDAKAKEVFDATLGKNKEVTYSPLCVSTQVVAGTNYRFLCSTVTATDPKKEGNATAVVYLDLQGNMKIADTKECEPKELLKIFSGEPIKKDSPHAPGPRVM